METGLRLEGSGRWISHTEPCRTRESPMAKFPSPQRYAQISVFPVARQQAKSLTLARAVNMLFLVNQ